MRYLLAVLAILLLGSLSNARPYDFEWKTPRGEVEKSHRLDIFQLESLDLNLIEFMGKEEAGKFSLWMVDDMKYRSYCEQGMFTVMGFYDDSLIFYFLSTEEMPYSEEDTIGKCLQDALFPDDAELAWEPIFKAAPWDGNIFLEGALVGVGETETDYLAIMNSVGSKGLTNPEHSQYACFFFDRGFLSEVVSTKLRIHDDHKKTLHPTTLFIEFIADEYEKYRKEPKGK